MIWPGQNLPVLELRFHLATSCLVWDPVSWWFQRKQISKARGDYHRDTFSWLNFKFSNKTCRYITIIPPTTWEAEAGGSRVWCHPRLYETLSQTNNKNKKTNKPKTTNNRKQHKHSKFKQQSIFFSTDIKSYQSKIKLFILYNETLEKLLCFTELQFPYLIAIDVKIKFDIF
jgi:hypothetical protein